MKYAVSRMKNASRTELRNRCNKYQSKTACILLLGGGVLSCSSDKLSFRIGHGERISVSYLTK